MARLTMRELRGLTPRQLWDLAEEHGIEVPPRATSADVRSALVGYSSGAVTTSDAAVRGEIDSSAAPPAPEGAGVPDGSASPAAVASGSALLDAAVDQLEDREAVTEAVVSAVLGQLTVSQLRDLSKKFDVDVERAEGDGDPVHEDYVRDLSAAALEGATPAADDEPAAPASPDESQQAADQEAALRDQLGKLSKGDLAQRAEASKLEVTRTDGRADLKPRAEDYVEALVADSRS